MSFILRDYQEEATQASVDILTSKNKTYKQLVISPTAGGKSIIVAETVKRIDTPVIVLQPSKELLLQNYEKFVKVGGKASICCASLKVKTEKGIDYARLASGEFIECRSISKVTYATVGTVKKYAAELKKLGVKKAIIDEAHLSTKAGSQVRQLFKDIGITHIVGLTATPLYLEGGMNGASLKMMNRARWKMFTGIKYITQISELVEKGFWSKLLYQVNDTDETYLQENSNGSDFTVQSQKNYYEANNLKEQITEEVSNLIAQGRKSILVFVPTIAEAEELYASFPNSATVHSKMRTSDRDYVVKAFKELTIPVVFNVNVLSVGFDHPELDAIITSRSTNSIALFYQQIGRGVRIHPDKEDCKIVDFSGNVKRFGRVEGLHFQDLPHYGWGLFNDKNELLTDFPIAGEIRPTKDSLKEAAIKDKRKNEEAAENKTNPMFTFGMFKGKKLWDIAQGSEAVRFKSYCSWLYDKHQKGEWSFYGEEGRILKAGIVEYLRVPDRNLKPIAQTPSSSAPTATSAPTVISTSVPKKFDPNNLPF
jgi:DNA repair protein RadD